MKLINLNGLKFKITVNKKGSDVYKKVSYPIRTGIYSEIETQDFIFQYDLNGEIKYIQGKRDWPHPLEWIKRTKTNRWIYYFAGEYNDIFDAIGEYYLPCFQYPTNSLWKRNPFREKEVKRAIEAWQELPELFSKLDLKENGDLKNFLDKVKKVNLKTLSNRAKKLYSIIDTSINVLPPDSRHVDYDIIPVIISDGCIYNCKFCMVKSGKKFKERNWREIKQQIKKLKNFYKDDIINYSSIFLGENDALNSSINLLLDSIIFAYEEFDFKNSFIKNNFLFIFGSIKSFLKLKETDFKNINKLPFYTYINIGLESPDQNTLKFIGKPLDASEVKDCFTKAMEINKNFLNIEITLNFLFDPLFPTSHYKAIEELINFNIERPFSKGCIYLSPFNIPSSPKEMLRFFKNFKRKSKLPMYLYIIQKF